MKKINISIEDLEHFVKSYLPEGDLNQDPKKELTQITNTIIESLNLNNLTTAVEDVFITFYNLHYPMSVIEPTHDDRLEKPYIDTNSHAIYIAIDIDKINALKNIHTVNGI